jgi:hypothetical protein
VTGGIELKTAEKSAIAAMNQVIELQAMNE